MKLIFRGFFITLTILSSGFIYLNSPAQGAHDFIKGKKTITLEVWHSMEGFLEASFRKVVEDFHRKHPRWKVKLERKGEEIEVFEKGLAHARQKKGPHILQVYGSATQSMISQRDLYEPADHLLKVDNKDFNPFDPNGFVDPVREFYSFRDESTDKTVMASIPWNVSAGILFYNKDLFRKAGLDPQKPPRTWPEMEKAFDKLKKIQIKSFTDSCPVAFHVEYFSAWHNVPVATKENGFWGQGARLLLNSREHIFHLERLRKWAKDEVFSYQGRGNEAPESLFTSGQVAMLFQEAHQYPVLKKKVSFDLGVGFLPYWPHMVSKPYNLSPRGSSLWALSGASPEVQEGVAKLFGYLSSDTVQSRWHQITGYLPATKGGHKLSQKNGVYKDNPATEIAVLSLTNRPSTPHTRGVRLENYPAIRTILADQLEQAIAGEEPVRQALDNAVKLGNQILEENETSLDPDRNDA